MAKAELVGSTFGYLKVEAPVPRPERRVWLCRCICGEAIEVTTGNLRNGSYTNCGCKRSDVRRDNSVRHGHNRGGRRTKEYRAWSHIIGRCRNPNDHSWPEYGGRGITVCDRWADSFDAFLADVGLAPSARHSIDRQDNSRGYEPGNCRWATAAEQSRNTRRNVIIEGKCLVDFCAERGLSYDAIQMRLRRGIPEHLAISPLMGPAFRRLLSNAGK